MKMILDYKKQLDNHLIIINYIIDLINPNLYFIIPAIINNTIKYIINSLNDIIFNLYDRPIKKTIIIEGTSINILNCFLKLSDK